MNRTRRSLHIGLYCVTLAVLASCDQDPARPESPSPKQLTFGTVSSYDPDWSPDGQWIAFTSIWQEQQPSPKTQIYVIPAAGGSAIRYTSAVYGTSWPVWSPDGLRFAFSTPSPLAYFPHPSLAVMNASPQDSIQILVDTGYGGFTHSYDKVETPRWSPDGAKIAFVDTHNIMGSNAWSNVLGISALGEISALYPSWSQPPSDPIEGLDWSPDGRKIVFASGGYVDHDIWVVTLADSIATLLSREPGNQALPRWSPNGDRIAFVLGNQIWSVADTGGAPTQLTFPEDGEVFGGLTWSPDGNAIAYGAVTDSVSNIFTLSVK